MQEGVSHVFDVHNTLAFTAGGGVNFSGKSLQGTVLYVQFLGTLKGVEGLYDFVGKKAASRG